MKFRRAVTNSSATQINYYCRRTWSWENVQDKTSLNSSVGSSVSSSEFLCKLRISKNFHEICLKIHEIVWKCWIPNSHYAVYCNTRYSYLISPINQWGKSKSNLTLTSIIGPVFSLSWPSIINFTIVLELEYACLTPKGVFRNDIDFAIQCGFDKPRFCNWHRTYGRNFNSCIDQLHFNIR